MYKKALQSYIMPLMLKMWRVWMCVGLIFFWLFPPLNVLAAASCGTSSQPHSVTPGSTTTFQVTVNNTGPSNVNWIKVTRPSANFNITGASATGWLSYRTASNVVFDTGTLAPGAGITLSITAAAANVSAPAASWQSQVSEDSEGGGPVNCNGDTSVAIAPLPPAPTISGISVSNITRTSATASWNTDQPSNSVLRYGTTTSYGQTVSSNANVTAHSLNLSGLSAGTNYHFMVESTGAGGTSASGDNTFSTPAAPSVSSPAPTPSVNTATPNSPNTNPASGVAPTISSAPPSTPLQISLNPLQKSIYDQPPTFSGTASDPTGVSAVEYSIDGGSNWLGANSTGARTNLSFSFTPANLPDGNYNIVARALNTRSEQKLSAVIILIIDRIPPAIGGVQTAIGPQFLSAGSNGLLETVAGIDQKISVHAIGGPTSITIRAYSQSNGSDQHSFSLSQIPDTELWSAVTSFSKPGRYRLEATAIDGAGRQADKALGEIIAASPILLSHESKPVAKVAATLYAWESSLNNWIVWPADAYGQTNPQTTTNDGRLRFYLPAGRYYLQLDGAYRKTVSDIITLDRAQAITGSVSLTKSPSFGLGSVRIKLPSILPARFKLQKSELQKSSHATVDRQLDDFSLLGPDNRQLKKADITKQPTVLIYTPTWAPASSEQLAILNGLDSETKKKVIAFSELEDPAVVHGYGAAAGNNVDVWLDANSQLTKQLRVIHSPTAILVDQNGVIKTLMSGVLSKQAIIELIGSQ